MIKKLNVCVVIGFIFQMAHCIKCCCAPKPISTIEPVAYSIQFEQYFHDKFVVAKVDD